MLYLVIQRNHLQLANFNIHSKSNFFFKFHKVTIFIVKHFSFREIKKLLILIFLNFRKWSNDSFSFSSDDDKFRS